MRGFWPELLLTLSLALQFFALLLNRNWGRQAVQSFLFLLGMAGAFVLSILFLGADKSELFAGSLSLDELFRLPRATITLVALMLGSFILDSKTLPKERKPEILFMITALCLFGRILLLSQNYLLSFLCLLEWRLSRSSSLAFPFETRSKERPP